MRSDRAGYLMLLGVPVLVSLSWVLGGGLVQKISPMVLSSSRLLVGALILGALSDVFRKQRELPSDQVRHWWKNQVLLSLTGRVLYYYASTRALLSISSLDAVLVTTTMPIQSLFVERLLGARFSNPWIPAVGVMACATVAFAVTTGGSGLRGSLEPGHLEMGVATLAFVVHLTMYKRMTKDASPVNPLFAQFAFGALCLVPLDVAGYAAFGTLSAGEWVQFAVYSVVCGLLPFVLNHYCLQRFSPFIVSAVAILSPLFGMLFQASLRGELVSLQFMLLSLVSCCLIFTALFLNNRMLVAVKPATLNGAQR